MKKITKFYHKYYKYLILYKDDLEQIVNIFKDNFQEYVIESYEYKLDDITEINTLSKQCITDFKITGHDPYLSLDIDKFEARLYFEDRDDNKLLGIESKIDAILIKRTKKTVRFLKSYWFVVIITVIFVLNCWVFRKLTYGMAYAFLINVLGLVFWFMYNQKIPNNKIYVFNLDSRDGFFKRNKDSILLLLVGAFIGGILTFIGNFLFELLKSKLNISS